MPDATRRHRDGGGWEESAGYSRAVRRFGHIAVSGTTARDVVGTRAADDCYAQTRSALEAAISALEALGGRVEDVVRTRVYLTPGADW